MSTASRPRRAWAHGEAADACTCQGGVPNLEVTRAGVAGGAVVLTLYLGDGTPRRLTLGGG